MKHSQIIFLKKTLQAKFGVFMHYSKKNSIFYCEYVSPFTYYLIVDFLNSDHLYDNVKVYRKPSGFVIIEL